jgi:type IV pilus assembly protein PilB
VESRQTERGLAVVGGKSRGDNLPAAPFSPVGCEKCSNTGYRGRIGIYELLMMNDKIRSLDLGQVDSNTVKDVAISNGMVTLRQDGLEKAHAGLTSMDEVLRVIPEEN